MQDILGVKYEVSWACCRASEIKAEPPGYVCQYKKIPPGYTMQAHIPAPEQPDDVSVPDLNPHTVCLGCHLRKTPFLPRRLTFPAFVAYEKLLIQKL